MKVLVAMSGGVDSSVAAALLLEAGHDVTGCTMRLWGGESDSGCCSVADVEDARRVAQQLGIDHFVFNFGDEFLAGVVEPYLDAHRAGQTPNPCVACNRTIKFDRLLRRADSLGFDRVATGHHARIVRDHDDDTWRLLRGADRAKDQSYVLHMLGQRELGRTLLPVGELAKDDVRARAADLGLRTAAKPDSQEVCFITKGGRERFVAERMDVTPGRVVDAGGVQVGTVDAVELVTIGQRRGLGTSGGGAPRYAVDVDVAAATVVVGGADDLLADSVELADLTWVAQPVRGPVLAQCSAHGVPRPATIEGTTVRFDEPARRVAPGQSVALYVGDDVVGGGTAISIVLG
jgi:tRNA-specific 2-thiouridylase